MTEKLSECCGAEVYYSNAYQTTPEAFCYKCGKPCTIAKPDASPDRLLTDEEINEVTIWCNHPAEIPKAIAKAQDAKTYPLAFEAGRKAQKEADQQTHEAIRKVEREERLAEYQLALKVTVEHEVAEAKKQGARELAEWVVVECKNKTHSGYKSWHSVCLQCWQTKLKEIEES